MGGDGLDARLQPIAQLVILIIALIAISAIAFFVINKIAVRRRERAITGFRLPVAASTRGSICRVALEVQNKMRAAIGASTEGGGGAVPSMSCWTFWQSQGRRKMAPPRNPQNHRNSQQHQPTGYFGWLVPNGTSPEWAL